MTGVMARSHCKKSFHCKKSLQEVVARSYGKDLLRRASCTEQLAQTNLRRFAQSALPGACRQLAGSAICTEQLAGSHLQGPLAGATCAELAQTNLHRPVCAEHLAWCCLALASQMLRVGNAALGPCWWLSVCCSRSIVSLIWLLLVSLVSLHQYIRCTFGFVTDGNSRRAGDKKNELIMEPGDLSMAYE